MTRKTYIGDGVYCEFDGYAFILTTENGIDITNVIVLEPNVFINLKKFIDLTSRQDDNENIET